MHPIKKRNFFHFTESMIAGVGAFIGLSLIGLIAQKADTMMIIAPFGATAVLLFSAPASPFSKPWNIFGSYFIATIMGTLVLVYTDGGWFSIGTGLGITIMLMHLAKVIHPPAGANFLIVTQGHLSIYLLEPLLLGLLTLIIIAIGIEKIKKKFVL
ncbi:HPP family protein [Sulfuricurvum sp.]|uniref:HPP family protein n=1 Tax=Sulfuricurvum sp. TaxID=2025608 RepID=UPI0035621DCD